MKTDPEKALKEAPRSRVPESLDDGVESLIEQAERRKVMLPRWRVSLWAAASICVTCALLGFFAGTAVSGNRSAGREIPGVIYIEELTGELPAALRETARRNGPGFLERARGDVKVIIGP